MRTRRRFQPILDSMPSRIAPSAVGLPAPTILAGTPSHLNGTPPGRIMVTADDNTSYPIIIAPIDPNPPATLSC
jgi:hypothetical protein